MAARNPLLERPQRLERAASKKFIMFLWRGARAGGAMGILYCRLIPGKRSRGLAKTRLRSRSFRVAGLSTEGG